MIMNHLIKRVEPINALPKSKHSTQDPNERRRRQLLLTYGYKPTVTESKTSFGRILQDTIEISKEGRMALERQK